MLRQQAKELLPIIQAYAEGKTIQVKASDNLWYEYNGNNNKLKFDSDPQNYRIKPEPKYRPFKNKEECWEEMQKHQPFGWVMDISSIYGIININEDGITIHNGVGNCYYNFNNAFNLTFADGTIFGIKDE
nr:MAG TPA: hypothetical protein [Caudoviricetes sp.]